jgi:hypothetical protein
MLSSSVETRIDVTLLGSPLATEPRSLAGGGVELVTTISLDMSGDRSRGRSPESHSRSWKGNARSTSVTEVELNMMNRRLLEQPHAEELLFV